MSAIGVNGALNVSRAMGFLLGDVNNDRSVSEADVSAVKARTGQVTDTSNFRMDLNASGIVTAADISAVKTRQSLVLP